MPAGLPVSAERVNAELKRRMGGYGRGARMKIESDQIEWLAGVRAGETLGSPIAMLVWNRDWEHWQDVMAPEADASGGSAERRRQVTRPRPGHAGRAGLARVVGPQARRAAGAGADVDPRGEGRRAGARLRSGAPQGLGGARRDSSRAGARHQPGGGHGGRHDDRRARGAARGDEADLDADVAAQDGGSEDRGARPGAVRALGCHRGAGDGGHRRGDGRARAGAGAAREVWWRCAERGEAKRRGVYGPGARPHPQRGGIVKKHIVLVGLAGSGKTTIGRLVAEQLRAGFVDIDLILARREGKPITLIFAEKGEAAFREMERKEMDAALATEPAVIAPGGGWAAQPGAIETAQPRALVVYLRARPETAAQRAASEEGTRPLLIGEDPVARMRQMLKDREPFYLKAHTQLDTERKTADAVAREVVRLAQTTAGW